MREREARIFVLVDTKKKRSTSTTKLHMILKKEKMLLNEGLMGDDTM